VTEAVLDAPLDEVFGSHERPKIGDMQLCLHGTITAPESADQGFAGVHSRHSPRMIRLTLAAKRFNENRRPKREDEKLAQIGVLDVQYTLCQSSCRGESEAIRVIAEPSFLMHSDTVTGAFEPPI